MDELCDVIVVKNKINSCYNDDYYDYNYENIKIYKEEKIWKLKRDVFETVKKNIHRYYEEIDLIEILDEDSISKLMEDFADFREGERNREKQREAARLKRQKAKDEKVLMDLRKRGLIDVR